jgi:hypothetical protein
MTPFQGLGTLWKSHKRAAFAHVANGTAFDAIAVTGEWFNPFAVESFSTFAAGVSLSVYWGWDATLTMNEETKDPEKASGTCRNRHHPGDSGAVHDEALAMLAYAGVGEGG